MARRTFAVLDSARRCRAARAVERHGTGRG
jgi:hypothetical protein